MNHVPKAVSECDSDPFLIWKPDITLVNAKLFQIRLLKREKKGVLDRDPPRKADFTLCERKALLEHDLCMRILEMRAEAMHGSICAVGTKHYLAVRRSCSWLGRRLQCLWTHVHVVQITNPITKQIAIRNGFGTWFAPLWTCALCLIAHWPQRKWGWGGVGRWKQMINSSVLYQSLMSMYSHCLNDLVDFVLVRSPVECVSRVEHVVQIPNLLQRHK